MHMFRLFIIIMVTALSGCTTILRADFESNEVGSSLGADLPGFPIGDTVSVPAPRFGTVFIVEEIGTGDNAHHELKILNNTDRSVPGWPTSVDGGPEAIRFISRPINFPDRALATTVRANIRADSGRLDMYLGNDENCAAMRLRFEDDKLTLLPEDGRFAIPLGEVLRGLNFSITLVIDRGNNRGIVLTAGRARNIRQEFTLPACASESLWTKNMLAIGFVSPAVRFSYVRIDVVEMSEDNRGE